MASNSRDRESAILAALAAELRAEAAKQRVGLRELARRSGIPYPTVQKSLAARRMIDVAELGRLCYALNVSPSALFARVDEWIFADETEPNGGDQRGA